MDEPEKRAGNASSSDEQGMVKERLRELLKSYVAKDVHVADIPDAADIRDYGVDSIGFLELFADIESVFHVKIDSDEIDLAELNSIESLSGFIGKLM